MKLTEFEREARKKRLHYIRKRRRWRKAHPLIVVIEARELLDAEVLRRQAAIIFKGARDGA